MSTKLARRDDPETSKAAAARVPHFASAHHAKIYSALLERPGTIYDLAHRTKLTHVQVARRLPELEELEVVEPTNETRPSPYGRACRVWQAVPVQRRLPL